MKLHLPGNDSEHPSGHRALLNPQHSAARTLAVASEPLLGCTPHLAQTLTHIRAAVVFLSTSCNSHFSPYPKSKTFFSFTIKFKLSRFEAQRKHRAEKHTAQNSSILLDCFTGALKTKRKLAAKSDILVKVT